MGSLLHWLKSSFTKVRNLQYLTRNVFFYVHAFTFHISSPDNERSDLPYQTLILFLPLLSFVFFLLFVL